MSLHDEIQQRENGLARAAAARDLPRVLAFYTPDALLMPAGLPTFRGREAIAAFFQGLPPAIVELRFTTEDVEAAGDGDAACATETGRFELLAQGEGGAPVVADAGRYLVVWRRVQGQWCLHRDMFNSDQPPPA